MTSVTAPTPVPSTAKRPAWGWAVTDAVTVTWRNLKGMSRVPEVIVFSTIQPIIFVLTFRYVFGGAIRVPGDYVDFLMPGVFVQTIAFGSMGTGIGLSEDLHKGLIERFRSLPMARSAVLAGRTIADLLRNVFVMALMVVVGFFVGFDYHTSALAFVASIGLLLLFGMAMSWIFAVIGLAVPNAEATQAASFPILALLVFASSAFVPIETMPGWLQAYNNVQPVSVAVEAARALALGGPTLVPVLQTTGWIVGLVAVFAPLAVARYRRSA
ncbi:MAG TPA: ABC transporter permease [Mycobacteriales bacterium]|nr:ABC transporter permease [Mycobacteriales bacterium]